MHLLPSAAADRSDAAAGAHPEPTPRARLSVRGSAPVKTAAPAPTTSPRAVRTESPSIASRRARHRRGRGVREPPDLRLAQDIVLAIAGSGAPAAASAVPVAADSNGRCERVDAARNAYRGFLRGQIERANARLLLLFGATATGLLDHDAQLGLRNVRRSPDCARIARRPERKESTMAQRIHARSAPELPTDGAGRPRSGRSRTRRAAMRFRGRAACSATV